MMLPMSDSESHKICLGLGSNDGDRMASLSAARAALADFIKIEAVSPVYETAAIYAPDQPTFLNAALIGTTQLEPLPLLYALRNIERDLGRMPTFRYGPRIIDLDLLFYDDLVVKSVELILPHPRIAERAFVLRPLVQIAPNWVHPSLRKTVKQMFESMNDFEAWKQVEDRF